MQGVFYGPYRQVLFGCGLLSRIPLPETYPEDVEVLVSPDAAISQEKLP
jgi:hypothetical protein